MYHLLEFIAYFEFNLFAEICYIIFLFFFFCVVKQIFQQKTLVIKMMNVGRRAGRRLGGWPGGRLHFVSGT